MDDFFVSNPKWQRSAPERLALIKNVLPSFLWTEQAIAFEQTLDFYPNGTFLMAKDPTWEPRNAFVYALLDEEEVTPLDGTSPGIHAFNAKGMLDLNDKTVFGYLSFFTFFVRGGEGPFYMAATPDSAYLPDCVRDTGDNAHTETRRRFLQIYQSPRLFGRGGTGNWRASATIYYSNAVFIADFEIQPTGMVEMRDDNPVLSDLPAKIHAPLAPLLETSGTIH